LIGMAFGLGFVFGPLLGGMLLSLPIADDWRLRVPFLVAAAFSTLAWVLVLTRLPESRHHGQDVRETARVASWNGIAMTLSIPGIGRLIIIGFLAVFAFAAFEGTFALYLRRQLQWDERDAAFAFAGIGLLSAVVQGGLIRRLVPRFGEARLIIAGLVMAACGFAGMALVSNAPELAGSMMLLGVGQGLLSPSVSGLLSRCTPIDAQGTVFGTLTSAQTFARMISYSASNILLGRFSPSAPYWGAFVVELIALAAAMRGGANAAEGQSHSASVTDARSPEHIGIDQDP
jgi:MFS transporter, DHA1 family, tetracycline resistance protein